MTAVFWGIELLSTFIESSLCLFWEHTFIEGTSYKGHILKNSIIAAIVTAIMYFINHISLYSTVTMVITTLLILAMSIAAYPKNKFKTVVLAISYFLLLIIIDNIIVRLLSGIAGIPMSEIYLEFSLYRFAAIVASKTALLFTVVTINQLFKKKQTLQRKYLISLFVITILLLIVSVAISFADIRKSSDSVIGVLFFVVMLLLLLIIFFGTFKLADYYQERQELHMMQMKSMMLERSIEDTRRSFESIRISLHDYKHNIVHLSMLAENNDIQGIKEYLSQQDEILGKRLFYYKTGNDTVDAILYMKQKAAEKSGITFIINAKIPENCPISSEHFVSVLGNLLDNAIEASHNENDPFIELKINDLNGYFWMIVKNKCTSVNKSLKTTKSDKSLHGIGLNSVKNTISKYGGDISIDSDGGIFEVRIMIPME